MPMSGWLLLRHKVLTSTHLSTAVCGRLVSSSRTFRPFRGFEEGPFFPPVALAWHPSRSTWLCGVPRAAFSRAAPRYETSETEEDRPGMGDVFARD